MLKLSRVGRSSRGPSERGGLLAAGEGGQSERGLGSTPSRSLTPASAKRFSDKIANAGRHVFVAALSGLRSKDDGAKRSELPEGLRDCPTGEIGVVVPAADDAWDEVFRDFARVLQGRQVYIIGKRRLYAVEAAAMSQDGVHTEARLSAFDDLKRALERELVDQGCGLSPRGRREGEPQPVIWRRLTLDFSPHGHDEVARATVDATVLRELALQVASHVSVGPGVQVALSRGLPPTLWQPSFTVCVGDGQVRVLTFAFVGEPVMGDRPDRKCTPFCLRIATEDLVEVATAVAQGKPRAAEAQVRYAAEPVPDRGVSSTLEYIVSLEEDLFAAIEEGKWSKIMSVDQPEISDGSPERSPERRAANWSCAGVGGAYDGPACGLASDGSIVVEAVSPPPTSALPSATAWRMAPTPPRLPRNLGSFGDAGL